MKKSICILVIVFLTYGKGFASSNNFENLLEVHSVEKLFASPHHTAYQFTGESISKELTVKNNICKALSNECFNYTFLMTKQNKECEHFEEPQNLSTETTFQGGSMIYYRLIDIKKTDNNINLETINENSYTQLDAIELNIKRLKNVNLEEYFFQPIDPNYYRGVGIRLSF